MKVVRCTTAEDLGEQAAALTAQILNEAIADHGEARVVLSTGASQFTTLAALVKKDVDWSKVTMFHLDEYVGMDESHPASFVRYLKDRFVSKVNLKAVHFVQPSAYAKDGDDGVQACIAALTKYLREKPIDLGLIGIGENTHIAFNDPPADFNDKNAYKVVNLDDRCRHQQLGEGWFPTLNDVPKQAISMTVWQIMQCKKIISAVPYAVKAEAVYKTLTSELTPYVPATMLKTHADATMFIDKDLGGEGVTLSA